MLLVTDGGHSSSMCLRARKATLRPLAEKPDGPGTTQKPQMKQAADARSNQENERHLPDPGQRGRHGHNEIGETNCEQTGHKDMVDDVCRRDG